LDIYSTLHYCIQKRIWLYVHEPQYPSERIRISSKSFPKSQNPKVTIVKYYNDFNCCYWTVTHWLKLLLNNNKITILNFISLSTSLLNDRANTVQYGRNPEIYCRFKKSKIFDIGKTFSLNVVNIRYFSVVSKDINSTKC
jgi:hypothetical protein